MTLAQETRALTERKLLEKQAYDVELSQARVDESQARVLLADLEKNSRIAQRQLAVVLHQSRLLVPQDRGPLPIELDAEYSFDLDDPDLVDLTVVPDFPGSRDEAIQLAKRQRVEVRILVVGLRIARLRRQRDWLRLFGTGVLPAELSFKNTNRCEPRRRPGCDLRYGCTAPPLVDVDLWASIRQARLDVIQSQLDLEKSLIDVANDAGNAWDRWQQAIKEWEQREAELGLRREYLDRQERLFRAKAVDRARCAGGAGQPAPSRCQSLDGLVQSPVGPPRRLAVDRAIARLCGEGGDRRSSVGTRAIPPPGFWKHRLALADPEPKRRTAAARRRRTMDGKAT